MNLREVLDILDKKIKNIRIYFCMKKGNDYFSYSPSIESNIYDEIIQLTKEYIIKFVDYEQVEFSPVGYKEGTIEICDYEYISSFNNVIDSFKETFVDREPINSEDINKLNFYCIKIMYKECNEDKELFLFRRVTKFKKLSTRGMFGTIQNNRFSKINSDLLGLDGDIDIIAIDGKMFIFNHIALERIFSLSNQYSENAKEAIDIIKKADRISNFEQFEEDCLNDRRVTRMLTKMLSEEDDLENCFANFSNVVDVIDIFELNIDIDTSGEKDIIVYENKEQLLNVIRLVRDSYYKSIIRDRHGIDESV